MWWCSIRRGPAPRPRPPSLPAQASAASWRYPALRAAWRAMSASWLTAATGWSGWRRSISSCFRRTSSSSPVCGGQANGHATPPLFAQFAVDLVEHVGPLCLLRLDQGRQVAAQLDEQTTIERRRGGLGLAALGDAGQEGLGLLVEGGDGTVAHEGRRFAQELFMAPTALVFQLPQPGLELRGVLMVQRAQCRRRLIDHDLEVRLAARGLCHQARRGGRRQGQGHHPNQTCPPRKLSPQVPSKKTTAERKRRPPQTRSEGGAKFVRAWKSLGRQPAGLGALPQPVPELGAGESEGAAGGVEPGQTILAVEDADVGQTAVLVALQDHALAARHLVHLLEGKHQHLAVLADGGHHISLRRRGAAG